MILLIHQQAKKVIKVRYKDEELKMGGDVCKTFWELAEKYPNDIIAWCEEDFENNLSLNSWPEVFHHDFIMASYAIKSVYLTDAIGYIDQLPFVNVNRKVQYSTWRMSTDVGGLKGKTLLKFKNLFEHVEDFSLLLDSIAKLGQQNGLFCYSSPQLVKEQIRLLNSGQKKAESEKLSVKATASHNDIFAFVYSHYKSIRVLLLFWCFIKYEKTFPLLPVIRAVFQQKYFKKEVDLSNIEVKSRKNKIIGNRIDVIIPSLGRREYLLQVLEDLKSQTLLPKKVIVVEQNPQPDSQTEVPELKNRAWPFEIIHHFTHQTGACNARNIALEEVDADWVFFADDDNEMGNDVLERALQEIKRLGSQLLTLKYSQKEESLIFDKVKQWGTFGGGNSIVGGEFASQIRFDRAFEYGYGEDKDYGMQLRNTGCDIIYHPNIEILHLKAPRGGFREISLLPWEKDKPKPSPTLMIYAKKYYTLEQLKGFKNELFLRFYLKQEIKNPMKYYKTMKERWRKSEEWAQRLMGSSEEKETEEIRKEKIEKRAKNQESRSSL
ncbi:glycosyltransferase family 2 protein [Salegentibacter agarivorans]